MRPTTVATPQFFGKTFFMKAHMRTEPKLKRTPPAALELERINNFNDEIKSVCKIICLRFEFGAFNK